MLAPTGTIGFMMDCDTTGVEPDIALVKYKKLVGGGLMKIVNQTVPMALAKLGYTPAAGRGHRRLHRRERDDRRRAGAEGRRTCRCSTARSRRAKGQRSIHYMGHIKMMGATQPFISGAISKTVNVPKEATVDEIMQAYIQSWKLGAKAISIYRDGSKRTQPLNTSKDKTRGRDRAGRRRRSSSRSRSAASCRTSARRSRTSSTSPGHEGYITVGLFEDGQPGEIFLVMAKEGSTISGFADAFAQAISYALQYGVPLQALVDKFSHVRFEPSGMTRNPEIRFAKSIVDYIFRWMATKFLSPEAQFHAGVNNREERRDERRRRSRSRTTRSRRRQVGLSAEPPKRGTSGNDVRGCDDSEPGRRAAVLHVRLDHGPQRQLLQVRELRNDERLRVGKRLGRLTATTRGRSATTKIERRKTKRGRWGRRKASAPSSFSFLRPRATTAEPR